MSKGKLLWPEERAWLCDAGALLPFLERCAVLEARGAGETEEGREVAASLGDSLLAMTEKDDAAAGIARVVDGVGEIAVSGMLVASLPGWMRWYRDKGFVNATGYDEIAEAAVAFAQDPAVERVVLRVSSGGGMASGCEACGDVLEALAGVKPVSAVVQGMGASAAYWLASRAGEVLAAPDAFVGSIGVVMVGYDESAAFAEMGVTVKVIASGADKGAWTPGAPVRERDEAVARENVMALAARFRDAVERTRGVLAEEVYSGRVWIAGVAEALGLIDGVKSQSGDWRSQANNGAVAPEEESVMTDAEKAAFAAEARAAGVTEGHAAGLAEGWKGALALAGAFLGAFAEDAAFGLKCFAEGMDLTQAKAAFADELAGRLKASELALSEAKAAQREPGPETGAPLGGGAAGASAGGAVSFAALVEAKVAAAKAAGQVLSIKAASKLVAAEHPGIDVKS